MERMCNHNKGEKIMRRTIRLVLSLWMMMALLGFIAFVGPQPAHASVAGRFTMVTGKVDLLKQGKLPAIRAKVQDGVEPGDIIRTKSRSKAQLQMVDDSIITLAPESRLAIADYQYKTAPEERRAVLRFFRGLMQATVKRIIKREEPDFIIETHTAVVGVRGSNPYVLLRPAFTTVYLPEGLLDVRSSDPNIPLQVPVHSMEFTQIPLGKQPYLPQPMTPAMLQMLKRMMTTGVTPGALYVGPPPAPGEEFPFKLPVSPDQRIRQETIPPVLVPKPQIPPPPPPPLAPSHPSGSPGGGSGMY
jgi:hypothetical protein